MKKEQDKPQTLLVNKLEYGKLKEEYGFYKGMSLVFLLYFFIDILIKFWGAIFK